MIWTVFEYQDKIIECEFVNENHYSRYQVLYIQDQMFCVTDVREDEESNGDVTVKVTLEKI